MRFASPRQLWKAAPIAFGLVSAAPLGCEARVIDPFPAENSDLSCQSSGDCALPAVFCDDTTRRCVECRDEDDCDRGTCDLVTHSCRRSCSTNNDCEGQRRRFCESDRGICVECSNNTHCVVGLRQCKNDVCIECTSDEHCVEGDERRCEIARNRCRECLRDADCPDGSHCDEGEMRCEYNSR